MKRYIPNIISQEHKVLPEYFKETINNKRFTSLDAFLSILAIIFFILSLATFAFHTILSFLLILTGFIILPWGKGFFERKLQFNFSNSLRLKTLGIISIFTVFCTVQFFETLKEIKENNRLVDLKRIAEQERIVKSERLRKDSLGYYLNSARIYQQERKQKRAISQLINAQKFASNNDIEEINLKLADAYFNERNFKKAYENYNKINNINDEIYYKKAICSNRLGDTQSAMREFKRASELGNDKAEREYDKLNPMIKYIVDYRTLCCDGTFSPSNAKGRGACSHHGGVCNWNYPIYQERRKYETTNF